MLVCAASSLSRASTSISTGRAFCPIADDVDEGPLFEPLEGELKKLSSCSCPFPLLLGFFALGVEDEVLCNGRLDMVWRSEVSTTGATRPGLSRTFVAAACCGGASVAWWE